MPRAPESAKDKRPELLQWELYSITVQSPATQGVLKTQGLLKPQGNVNLSLSPGEFRAA